MALEAPRKPFVFGVAYITDEAKIGGLLHQQFDSDALLAAYVKSLGYEINFEHPRVTVDTTTGVIAEMVELSRGGRVGALDLIDEADKPKVATLIEKAAGIAIKSGSGS